MRTRIWFPGLTIPGKIKAGVLLNVSLFRVGLKIPPWNIVLWEEPLRIWGTFKIFDTQWIVDALSDLFSGIPEAVWALFQKTLDDMAADYYERHSEEEK